jgi:hypothetical protein
MMTTMKKMMTMTKVMLVEWWLMELLCSEGDLLDFYTPSPMTLLKQTR